MFRSLLVNVDRSNDLAARVKLAANLADRFDARLIGAGAHDFIPFVADGVSPGVVMELQRDGVEDIVKEAEARFKRLTAKRPKTESRFDIQAPQVHLIAQARAADLIVVPGGLASPSMGVDPGDIVMSAGKPVLVVPRHIDHLHAERIVIAWSDTTECRRAVQDALPLLDLAQSVWVASFGTEYAADSVKDVVEYLMFRGIAAQAAVQPQLVHGISSDLYAFSETIAADLIVAGAYGHSRTREWAFGGVTRDLLESSPVSCLLAH